MSQVEAPAPARAGWVRRHRAALLVAAALVLATATSLVSSTRPPYADPLDPQNAGPDGARAVARVLGREGVDVDIVRDADAFDRTSIDAGTTVVVTSVGNLGPSTARRLLDHIHSAPLLLVDPTVGQLDLFDLREGVRIREHRIVTGRCADPRLDRLEVDVDRATAYPESTGACFTTSDGALLVHAAGRPTSVLGAGGLLTNDEITRADNAAVALRLLGARDRLVWYVPSLDDLRPDDAVGLGSLLPDWLGPGLWLIALAAVALGLWRGRRLGPLVTEPLPVTVTAIESTRSRGRLYRKAGDRAHAAGVLRRAARTRIAEHLGLPRSTTSNLDGLLRHIAAHSDSDLARVHQLLSPDADVPRTDKDLTQLAHDLAELDREVRRP